MMGEAAFVISDADDGLRERLSQEISAFNVAATGLADGALLGIAVREDRSLRAGLAGWTWGGCGYIAQVGALARSSCIWAGYAVPKLVHRL